MYNNISVVKPTGIASGAAAAKDPNIIIFDFDDVLTFAPRDSKGVRMVGDIVFKPGKYPIAVYMTKSKISAPYESDGDEDSISIKQSYEGQHPGNKLEIREFIQNWLGRNVGIAHRSCAEAEWEIVGTPCAPLQLKPSKQDNNDGRFHMLKFEAFAKSSFLPGHYTGNLTTATPVAVADVTEIAVDKDNGLQHKLAATAVTASIEIASVDAEDRSLVTFIGGGGAGPATLAQGAAGAVTVILTGGVTWTALDQSVITLQYVNAGATKYLVEQNRT